MTADNSGSKQRGKPFKKGQSGNPAGRPKGSRNRASCIVDSILEPQAQAVAQAALDRALKGDSMLLKELLNRLAPPIKERPIQVDLPALEGAAGLPGAAAAIIQAGASGELTPGETSTLIGALVGFGKAVDIADFGRRLEEIEKRLQEDRQNG